LPISALCKGNSYWLFPQFSSFAPTNLRSVKFFVRVSDAS
jgi:hypothetical protein